MTATLTTVIPLLVSGIYVKRYRDGMRQHDDNLVILARDAGIQTLTDMITEREFIR
ncbi:MAG: hypothetical protein O7198_01540 [Wolbachia endosymbiont of Nomada marshamella]|nr:hypothetical protein [Wolbachia endosymbiont of Nomada marshamella]